MWSPCKLVACMCSPMVVSMAAIFAAFSELQGIGQYQELIDLELLKMGAFIAAEMTPQLFAPSVRMPVLMIQVLQDAWTRNPEDAQRTFDLLASEEKELFWIEHTTRRFKDGYNYFGRHPEKIIAFFDRHIEHVGDRLAFVEDFERLAIVAFALAGIARDVDVRQEVHLDLDKAVAGAFFAAATLDVEAEPPRLVPARLRLGQSGEPVANIGEGAGIGGGVGSRGAANGRLVDVDYLVEMFQPAQAVMRARHQPRTVQRARCRRLQCVDNQARLARTRNPGDAGEGANGNGQIDIAQIIGAGTL